MDYKKINSQTQLERDSVVYILLKEREQRHKIDLCILLHDYVDFNAVMTLKMIIPLIARIEAIEFVLKNKDQLKNKFTLSAFLEFCRVFNLVNACYSVIVDFKDLKYKHQLIKDNNNQPIKTNYK